MIMIQDYLHLAPRFIRDIFKDGELELKLLHPDEYKEIESIAKILEQETYIVLMLNYAYEIGEVLCTSIVAKQADGTIIHGRNLDFAFPDAMRNASFIGDFY